MKSRISCLYRAQVVRDSHTAFALHHHMMRLRASQSDTGRSNLCRARLSCVARGSSPHCVTRVLPPASGVFSLFMLVWPLQETSELYTHESFNLQLKNGPVVSPHRQPLATPANTAGHMSWAYQGTLNACIQILLIIGLGYGMAWKRFISNEKFLPQVNVFMLLVSFPCINLYLIGITLDLRDPAGWKAMAAYILWITIVQIAISVYVFVFGGRNGSEAAVLNLLLTANNTFIIGLPIMDATWGSRGRSLALLTGVPLFLQVFPYSIILFEKAQISKAQAALQEQDSHSAPDMHVQTEQAPPSPHRQNQPDQPLGSPAPARGAGIPHTVLDVETTGLAVQDADTNAKQSLQLAVVSGPAAHAAPDTGHDDHQADGAVQASVVRLHDCSGGAHQSCSQGSAGMASQGLDGRPHVRWTLDSSLSAASPSQDADPVNKPGDECFRDQVQGAGCAVHAAHHDLGAAAACNQQEAAGGLQSPGSIQDQQIEGLEGVNRQGRRRVWTRLKSAWHRSAPSYGFDPISSSRFSDRTIGGLSSMREAPSWGHQSSVGRRSFSFGRRQPMHADVGWLFVWNRPMRRSAGRLPRSWSYAVRERVGDGLTGARTRWLPLFITIIKNPVLVSLIASCIISVSGLNQFLNPKSSHYVIELGWLVNALSMLASTTVPLALFSNGAFLYGKRFWQGNMSKAVVVVLIKIVLLPPLQLACAKLLALDTADAMALLLLSVCPCATTSFVLASQYKHGAEMTTIVTVVLTILLTPLMLATLRLPLVFNLYNFDTSKFPLP